MEIAIFNSSTLRLKGKTISLVIDPSEGKAKLQGDGVICLQNKDSNIEVEGSRITISGPGEYELSGTKITGVKSSDGVAYYLSLDGISLMLGKTSWAKGKDNLRDVDVALLFADNIADQSALATAAESLIIFYGPRALDNVKVLGKETSPVNKFVTTKDKLPSEMEVVLLQ